MPPSLLFDVTNTLLSCQSRTTCQTTSRRKPEHHNLIFKATKLFISHFKGMLHLTHQLRFHQQSVRLPTRGRGTRRPLQPDVRCQLGTMALCCGQCPTLKIGETLQTSQHVPHYWLTPTCITCRFSANTRKNLLYRLDVTGTVIPIFGTYLIGVYKDAVVILAFTCIFWSSCVRISYSDNNCLSFPRSLLAREAVSRDHDDI